MSRGEMHVDSVGQVVMLLCDTSVSLLVEVRHVHKQNLLFWAHNRPGCLRV